MSHLIINEPLLGQLRSVLEPVEFRDPSGKILGHYTPSASLEEPFDLEEAERVLATQKDQGRPLKEILRDLEATGRNG